jgi:hypothetical protein
LVDRLSLVKATQSVCDPDGESIMLGLYEWLHEEIENENTARREGGE